MPAETRCTRCDTVGFVRWEYVISAGNTRIQYYCGRCDHAWSVDDGSVRRAEPDAAPVESDRPDRSR